MRSRVAAAVLLALLVAASVCGAQWKMRVHQPGGNTDYTVSELDSVTFYFDAAPGMVLIPAGTFRMGDGSAHCGVDQFDVTLTEDFYLDQHEVTNQEYIDAVQWAYDNGYVTVDEGANYVSDNLDGSTQVLADLNDDYLEIDFVDSVFILLDPSRGDHPMLLVTWYGAARYCDWLSMQAGWARAYADSSGDWLCNGGDPYRAQGFRLPTDAEWEYAAQYDDERTYPWGEATPDSSLANFGYWYGDTTPVGYCSAGASSLGVFDMAGNVYEWCDDGFYCDLGTVYTGPVTDPSYPYSSQYRVIRGGSWKMTDPTLCCAHREGQYPHTEDEDTGFRTARTVSPGP